MPRVVFGALAILLASSGAACSSTSDDDGAGAGADLSAHHGQVHIAPGVELARAAATSGSLADKQRASVHYGNAYWLIRMSMLSYWPDNDAGIKSTLSGWGFDGAHTRVFANSCTGGYALYVPADGLGIVVFRGTSDSWSDWSNDLDSTKIPWTGEGLVHTGFYARFLSLWEADPKCGVPEGLATFLAARHTPDATGKSPGGALYLTGHSLGAALATLALAHTQIGQPKVPVSALYTFGSPRVGNEAFAYSVADAAAGKTAIFRVVHGDDIVTSVPTDFDPIEALFSDYRHIAPRGEDESIFEVWVKDHQLKVAEPIAHPLWSWSDHGGYEPELEFHAGSHNQLH